MLGDIIIFWINQEISQPWSIIGEYSGQDCENEFFFEVLNFMMAQYIPNSKLNIASSNSYPPGPIL